MASTARLLQTLSRLGSPQAGELAKALGVSQPNLSRLVADAGDNVCRMGRTWATSYARTRALPGLGTRLPIYRVRRTGEVEEPPCTLHLLESYRHWLEDGDGQGTRFERLPPFAADMSPQGYVGRGFSVRFPELELPPSLSTWNDDHRLTALARRGEDCVGNLIVGEESLNRFLASSLESADRESYPELARRSAQDQPGPSAGGEQPKFLTYSEGRHVLVKFVGSDEGAVARRWRDLLVCEHLALEAVRAAGLEVSSTEWLDVQGHRFLEVERFDRVGARGRRGVITLIALDNEYFGSGRSRWALTAQALLKEHRISPEDARRIRWLDAFGELSGNTDRHLGNLSFFQGDDGQLQLAPLYDMLPMVFAPAGTVVVDRVFQPSPPTADTLGVWSAAALHARDYWTRLISCDDLSANFRELAQRSRDALDDIIRQVGPTAAAGSTPGSR